MKYPDFTTLKEGHNCNPPVDFGKDCKRPQQGCIIKCDNCGKMWRWVDPHGRFGRWVRQYREAE